MDHVFTGPGLVASKMDVAEESMGVEAFTRARFYRHIIKTAATPARAITEHLSADLF